LLLIVPPKFASQRGVAQLPFGLERRRWAAGSFGQSWPEVWLFVPPTLTLFGPAEHAAEVGLLSVCHCIIGCLPSDDVTWAQCCKTLYGRKLRIFFIS
jgi:hypothetical protein